MIWPFDKKKPKITKLAQRLVLENKKQSFQNLKKKIKKLRTKHIGLDNKLIKNQNSFSAL